MGDTWRRLERFTKYEVNGQGAIRRIPDSSQDWGLPVHHVFQFMGRYNLEKEGWYVQLHNDDPLSQAEIVEVDYALGYLGQPVYKEH